MKRISLTLASALIAAVAATAAMPDSVMSVEVRGSIAADGISLHNAGGGLWRNKVTLNRHPDGPQYVDRYIYFTFNGSDSLQVKRVAGSDSIAAGTGENIRLNNGTYDITLDLSAGTYRIEAPVDTCRISVFGSSVANGQGAPEFKGYAYMYGELLKQRHSASISPYPLHTSGVSIGGNTTSHLLARYGDVLNDFGRFVVIGLSLGNEGIHGNPDQEKVVAGFRDNMLEIIRRLRSDGKYPVVVNSYPRGDYNDADYACVKTIDLLIHQWDVPSVNALGAIDDGAGHWAQGYIADVAHPDGKGHHEFMRAFVPSLFDAIIEGKPLPARDMSKSGSLSKGNTILLTPEATVHPFTVTARVKGGMPGTILSLSSTEGGTGAIGIATDGRVVYNAPTGTGLAVSAEAPLADNRWHDVTLTHYYAQGVTHLYVDGVLTGSVSERFPLGCIIFGDADNKKVNRGFSEITFWRSAMTADEILAHHRGAMLKSSLELYSPFAINDDGNIPNLAQSKNALRYQQHSTSGGR